MSFERKKPDEEKQPTATNSAAASAEKASLGEYRDTSRLAAARSFTEISTWDEFTTAYQSWLPLLQEYYSKVGTSLPYSCVLTLRALEGYPILYRVPEIVRELLSELPASHPSCVFMRDTFKILISSDRISVGILFELTERFLTQKQDDIPLDDMTSVQYLTTQLKEFQRYTERYYQSLLAELQFDQEKPADERHERREMTEIPDEKAGALSDVSFSQETRKTVEDNPLEKQEGTSSAKTAAQSPNGSIYEGCSSAMFSQSTLSSNPQLASIQDRIQRHIEKLTLDIHKGKDVELKVQKKTFLVNLSCQQSFRGMMEVANEWGVLAQSYKLEASTKRIGEKIFDGTTGRIVADLLKIISKGATADFSSSSSDGSQKMTP